MVDWGQKEFFNIAKLLACLCAMGIIPKISKNDDATERRDKFWSDIPEQLRGNGTS